MKILQYFFRILTHHESSIKIARHIHTHMQESHSLGLTHILYICSTLLTAFFFIHYRYTLFSSFFQDLVRQMLDVEPSKRPSAANILKHPWMTCLNPPSTQLVVTSEAHHLKVRPFFYSYCCWQQFVPSAHSELKIRRKEYIYISKKVKRWPGSLPENIYYGLHILLDFWRHYSAVREPGGYSD